MAGILSSGGFLSTIASSILSTFYEPPRVINEPLFSCNSSSYPNDGYPWSNNSTNSNKKKNKNNDNDDDDHYDPTSDIIQNIKDSLEKDNKNQHGHGGCGSSGSSGSSRSVTKLPQKSTFVHPYDDPSVRTMSLGTWDSCRPEVRF